MSFINSSETPPNPPKRVTEIPDPRIEQIFTEAEDDRVGGLVQNLPDLTLKQKVHALLLLSDDEFTDFQERRKGGAEIQLSVLQNQIPDSVNPKDYIKAVTHLRDTLPRYEVEAEIRRSYNGQYPVEWDQELEVDSRFKPDDGLIRLKDGKTLNYEEAVEFTKFENVRKWYRNRFFPQVARRDEPIPLKITNLVELFKQERSAIFGPHQPGTDIYIADLLPVLDYYLYEHEPDNYENCQVHEQVKQLVGIIKEMEEAIKD